MPEAGHPVLPALLARLTESLGDARLDDGERRDLAAALAETPPSEESLRRLRNCAFGLVRDRTTDAESLELLRWLERVVRTLDVARGPNATVYSEVFFSPGPACTRYSGNCAPHAGRWTCACSRCPTTGSPRTSWLRERAA